MQKAKKYDWKDSNLALFGSDLEKNVKKASAETEIAWKGAGLKVNGSRLRTRRYERGAVERGAVCGVLSGEVAAES